MGSGDGALVLAAQGGDEDAFGALVERHWRRMVGFARSMVGDQEAEDAAQEAFVTAWRKIRDLRDPERFSGWLSRVLARSCWRRGRSSRPTVPIELVAEPVDPAARSPRSELDVERLLGLLAPRQRAVMHLTVVAGMSDSEIGKVLEIEPGSVRAHRRRARDRLRAVLAPTER